MTFFNFLVAFSAVLFAFYLFILRRFSYWSKHKVPFIEPKFPFGNLQAVNRKEHYSQEINYFYRSTKNKGPIIGIFYFTSPVLLINDLELIQHILIKDFQYFQNRLTFYNERTDPLSAHLFNLDFEKWKPLRSKLTPTFTSGKMKFMFPTIVAVANEFNKCLSEISKTDSKVEIRDLLGRFTTDVIGTCAFGIECNSLKDPNTKFRLMGKKVFDQPKLNIIEQLLIFISKDFAKFVGIRAHHKDVTEFFLNIVKETVDYREKNDVKRNDFMDLLIQLKKDGHLPGEVKDELGLSINEIAAQAFVFFLAGFETSSTTLTYCLYELSLEKNKHIQDKARREINFALKKYGSLTYDALAEMTYIEQIINETLRKHPPASVFLRVASKKYDVPNMNFSIPKDMVVIIPVFGVHHDPDFYDDPEEFIPERFSPEEVKKRPSCSFLPFGDGPRNCIGLRFGMLQARIGLVSLLKCFEFSTCDRTDIPLQYCPKKFILSPKNGLWLNVNQIDKSLSEVKNG